MQRNLKREGGKEIREGGREGEGESGRGGRLNSRGTRPFLGD